MMNKQLALSIVAGLSEPSKMPCHGFSIPAKYCKVGQRMRNVVGSICSKCYALKGNYTRFPKIQEALERRYANLNHPQWVEAMAFLINTVEKSGFFRWHDSGDIQSVEHLNNIAEVCKLTPNVQHWLPTREYVGEAGNKGIIQQWFASGAVVPANLTIRLSALMLDGAPPTSIAARFGLPTSGVCKVGFTCPAPNQGNKCGDCRACWNKQVSNVNYKQH
jgi:hypothetical protein